MFRRRHTALAALLAAAGAWIPSASLAADSSQLPPETPSHQTVPEAATPGGSGSSSAPLSDKLDRSGGIIRPPTGIDPEISQEPPPAGPRSMPVIRPPGTPGGDSGARPK